MLKTILGGNQKGLISNSYFLVVNSQFVGALFTSSQLFVFFCSKCEMLRPIMPLTDILSVHEKVIEKCCLVSGFIVTIII